jgi:serine/threonine-protein kinase
MQGVGAISGGDAKGLGATLVSQASSAPPVQKKSESDAEGKYSFRRRDALGRYVVLDLLGKGGMGEVYSAYDPTLDRKVALKVLRPALSKGNSVTTARAQLTHEAQAMAKLSHPNVIQVFDVGTVDGDVYVAMEFIDGMSLRDWLSEERSIDEIFEIFRNAALGLASAHEAGLVHRDFKPDNVLIGTDGRVRVIDFGIASLGGGETQNADAIIEELTSSGRNVAKAYTTLTGVAAGTPAYMAPEQFKALVCDARTDQFSFAVALYEAIYKERPFDGENIAELSTNVSEGNLRSAPAAADAPSWVCAALTRSLSAKPEDRHESMHALLEALSPPQSWLAKHRTLALACGALIAGALLALLLITPDNREPTCQQEEELVAGIWDDKRAQDLESHFATSQLPYAKATASKIVERLNKHTEGWLQARKNVCLAAAREDLSEDLKMRGMACLDRRLRELDAIGTILSSATDEVIKNSPIVVSELSPIADCTNTTLLANGGAALPPQWQDIDDRFSELKALHSAGQYKELLSRAKELHQLAEDRGFARGIGESVFWMATGEKGLAMYDEAEEHYFEAIRIGQQEKTPRIRASAWEGLMSLAGYIDKPKEGLRWHKHAIIANEEAGVDPELQARITYLHGFLHFKMQNYEKALAQLRASSALYEKIFGPSHWRVSTNLSLASASLRRLARLDEAAKEGQRALEIATASLGPDHPRLATIHNGAANTLGRLSRYDEARKHYQEALRLTIATSGERSAKVGLYLSNMANLELRAGDFKEGLRLAEEALALRREFLGDGNAGVVRTQLSIAQAHYRLGELERALSLQADAVNRYQLILGEEHRATAGAHATLCDYQRRAKQYRAARGSCTKALAVLDPDAPDPRELALGLTLAAWLDLQEGKKDEALRRAERAYLLRQEHKSLPSTEGQTRFVLGMALHAQGKREEARRHVEAARQTIADGEPGTLQDLPAIDAFLEASAH